MIRMIRMMRSKNSTMRSKNNALADVTDEREAPQRIDEVNLQARTMEKGFASVAHK